MRDLPFPVRDAIAGGGADDLGNLPEWDLTADVTGDLPVTEGGTGASPELLLNHTGIPTISAIRAAREALDECTWLMEQTAPEIPALTFLGSHEQIVDRKAIRARMANWPSGTLVEIPDGEHEVLMEAPEVRGPVFDQLAAHFAAAAAKPKPEPCH